MSDQNAAPIVASSNFSYEPPAEPGADEHAEFNQSIKDVIGEIEQEFASDNPIAREVEAEATQDEPDVEQTQEPAPEADDPAVARGMDRLVQREVALQSREAAISQREARLATLEQENASLKAQIPAFEPEKLAHSPSDVIKAMGHDPKMVVRLMLAEQLQADGQEIPAALQDYVRKASLLREQATTNAKITQLERQLADRDQQASAAAYFNGVAMGAREYVTKQVEDKKFPTFANLVKQNPDRAHREIMEEITNDARKRASTDPNGEPLTYEAAAKLVEARLSDYATLVRTSPSTTQAPTGAAKAVPLQPVTKPPTKPLKPWETGQDDIYKRGIAEAEREFYRMEQQARAVRK